MEGSGVRQGVTGRAETLREIRVTRSATISDFTDLECWQLARKLRHEIYRTTRTFPKTE